MKIDYLWLAIGIALGMWVVPMLLSTLKGKTAKKSS